LTGPIGWFKKTWDPTNTAKTEKKLFPSKTGIIKKLLGSRNGQKMRGFFLRLGKVSKVNGWVLEGRRHPPLHP